MSTTVSTQGTEAFDAATVALALESYKQTAGSTDYWSSSRRSNVATSNQETLLDWMCDHGDALPNISPEWMHALASDDHRVLNALLEKHGFEPHFQAFAGIGIVAILDLLMQWQEAGNKTEINANGEAYPAFTLGKGVTMYRVSVNDNWCKDPLVKIEAANGICLWLMVTTAPEDPTDLALRASMLLSCDKDETSDFGTHITLPMVDIDRSTDLDWMTGMNITVKSPESGQIKHQMVDEARQQFRVRMNHLGISAQVGSSLVIRPIALPLSHLVDQPFMGFFTVDQPGCTSDRQLVPLATFFSGYDSWKEPTEQ